VDAATARQAVVVGAERDICRACVVKLASLGYRVLFVATDPFATCDQVLTAGGYAESLAADISDPDALFHAAQSGLTAHPAIHALVNCHLGVEPVSIEDMSVDVWERALRTNVTGPLFSTKAFLPRLKQANGSAVVHLGSVDGVLGNPRVPAYSAAKGALLPLTHLMGHEFAPYGIRVNCVARALVSSVPHADLDPYTLQIIDATPMARTATPDEIANVVAFLVSNESGYMTGSVVTVDGGRTVITPGTA
jgi:NAD(P)-dependent dehydrogenase (short-subunit alcohol dehydrogenase family)